MSKLSPSQTTVVLILFAIVLVLVVLIDAGLFIAWAFRKEDMDTGRKPPLFAPQWSLVDVWAGGQIISTLLFFSALAALVIQMGVSGGFAKSADPGSMLPFLLVTLVAQNIL